MFIWIVAIVLILGWPSDKGKSLATKAVNWLVDPTDSLPAPPKPLPMGLDDDGDLVAAHDMQEAEYNRLYVSSKLTRLRLRLKVADDPLEVSTQRQILAGIGILSALVVWRLRSAA
jgi:hypothetical protein